ncbi:MAG: uroporphyrinogen-III C-methyltransferase [Cytophagaceae bacterium]|nr:uroporphyrinogen-III C-methyltransferase [Cytophagaceae bacterium]
MTFQNKVSIVGAGPGDPDLITLKAVKALRRADVVLYDALVDQSLLDYCGPDTEKIYVGKRPGQSHSQDAINFLIVEKALAGNHVVRLKGGDPFIFGRGQEEIEFAQKYGLQTEYIPGISSAIAAPGYAGIPLTSRGVSESFWVVTGTKSDGSLSKDLCLALCSTATIVVLMGMNKLDEIADLCRKMGRADLPAAIIQNGTTADERSAIGTAAELPRLALEHKLSNPAVIVLGEVVNFATQQPISDWQNLLKSADLQS